MQDIAPTLPHFQKHFHSQCQHVQPSDTDTQEGELHPLAHSVTGGQTRSHKSGCLHDFHFLFPLLFTAHTPHAHESLLLTPSSSACISHT